MKSPLSILNNEKGFVLVFVILVLLVLVLVGISATTTTTIEIQIAANDKFQKTAFYNADGGIFTAPKVITQAINAGADPAPLPAALTLRGNGNIDSAGNWFYSEVMGFTPFQPATSGEVVGEADLLVALGNRQTNIDIVHAGRQHLAGGGVEFASGSSGVGGSSGIAINYDLISNGSGPDDATSILSARYRKIPGTAGGL